MKQMPCVDNKKDGVVGRHQDGERHARCDFSRSLYDFLRGGTGERNFATADNPRRNAQLVDDPDAK